MTLDDTFFLTVQGIEKKREGRGKMLKNTPYKAPVRKSRGCVTRACGGVGLSTLKEFTFFGDRHV